MSNVPEVNPLSSKFMAAVLLAEAGDDKRAADLLREMGAIMKQQALAKGPTGPAQSSSRRSAKKD